MSCNCIPHSRSRVVMGQEARLVLVGPQGRCFDRAFEAVFHVLDTFEQDMETVRQGMLCPYGDYEAESYVMVQPQVWELLRLANEIAYRTDGLFDVAAAGSEGIASWTDIDLSRQGFIRLRQPFVPSLGGIQRGFAVDVAVQAMREMGLGAGLVDIGGRIRAFGQRRWRVDFRPGTATVGTTGQSAHNAATVPVMLYEEALVGVGGMFKPRRLLDTDTKVVTSTAMWQDMNLLVRAQSAAVADALSILAALEPSSCVKELQPFGAEAMVLTSAGVEAVSYTS